MVRPRGDTVIDLDTGVRMTPKGRLVGDDDGLTMASSSRTDARVRCV